MISFSHALWSRHIMYTSLGTQRCPGCLRGSLEFPNQNLRQISPGIPELWLDKQTDRQTEITALHIDTPPLPSHPDTLYGIMLVKIRENCVNSNKTHLIPTLNIFLDWLFLGELTWNLRLTLFWMWFLMFYLFF